MKKILSVLMMAIMLAICANAAFEKVNIYKAEFSDIKSGAWYEENVKTAYELGFMNGKSEGKFDPDGNVTVAEGVTMAARLHSIYNGKKISQSTLSRKEYRLDFDSMDGIRLNHATGQTKDGVLVIQPDKPNAYGNYDPGIFLQDLVFEARRYNTMTIRMKRDVLPNVDPEKPRDETLEIYYTTEASPDFSAGKCFVVPLKDIKNLEDWFEVQVSLDGKSDWDGIVTSVRFDPTNNNGIYYIDYISLSEDTSKTKEQKWYDIYTDYAVQNGIVEEGRFLGNDFTENITRAEMCDLFAAALPEEYFAPINDVKGIPDVARDMKNSDVYLALYKAGILLGSDDKGTFNGGSDIRRSEVSAIINRVALPENRVKGTVSHDWSAEGNDHDIEFNDDSWLNTLDFDAESVAIKNGALVLKSADRGEKAYPRFDPKIKVQETSIDAGEYVKLRVRIKADGVGDVERSGCDFYFMTEGDGNFSEGKSLHKNYIENGYRDSLGWYVLELDLRASNAWRGNVVSFRFDPANTAGTYTIDYIRFTKADPLEGASHETLIGAGYTANNIFKDTDFERGFYIAKYDQTALFGQHGMFRDYCETDEKPVWGIAPWWVGYDLYENRDKTTDKYTLKDDKGVSTLIYNPEEKSVTLRLDSTKVFEGKTYNEYGGKWWPHLLIEQTPGICPVDKTESSAGADRMFVEMDVRLTDFKMTPNEGVGYSGQLGYFIYFYLVTDKAPGNLIWFGLDVLADLHANNSTKIGWSPDSAAHQYMYKIPQSIVYGGIENSFNPKPGVIVAGDEWKHIRVDVTPHIERAIEWANRDNAFGTTVTKEDMYFNGLNIGFEMWENYDCTIEFKNFNMISYNKGE